MSEDCRWRREMSERLAPLYAAHPKVAAVMLGGSTARGSADRFSDIEIGVFWSNLPTAEELQALAGQAQGTRYELDPYLPEEDIWYEEYEVGGVKMDMRHTTVARMEEILRAVLEDYDTAEERQSILGAVLDGIPLHGDALVARWQARMAHYPDGLAQAIVRQRLDLLPWWPTPMYAERGDFALVYADLSEATKSILSALCGLNRRYWPGMKWLEQTLRAMPLTPPDLYGRLQEAFRSEPRSAAEQMRVLIEETYDLAEREIPELDLREARAQFRYVRPIVDFKNPLQ